MTNTCKSRQRKQKLNDVDQSQIKKMLKNSSTLLINLINLFVKFYIIIFFEVFVNFILGKQIVPIDIRSKSDHNVQTVKHNVYRC